MKLADDLKIEGLTLPDVHLLVPTNHERVPEKINQPVEAESQLLFPPIHFLDRAAEGQAADVPVVGQDVDEHVAEFGQNQGQQEEWVCTECYQIFKTEKVLKRHKQKHIGVKFLCNICGKGYSRSDALKVHKKKQHP